MKMTLAAFAALTLFSPALAQATQDTSAMDHAAMAPVAQGSGVIRKIDLNGGSVTLQHGPIAALS